MSVPHHTDRPGPSRVVHDLSVPAGPLQRILSDHETAQGPILLVGDAHGVYIVTEDQWGETGVPVFATGYGPAAVDDQVSRARIREVTGPAGFRVILNPDHIKDSLTGTTDHAVLYVIADPTGERVVTGPYPAGRRP